MGKIDTWQVTERSDDTLTLLFQRRTFAEHKYALEEQDEEPEQQKQKRKGGLDAKTREVLGAVDGLNDTVRRAIDGAGGGGEMMGRRRRRRRSRSRRGNSSGKGDEQPSEEECDHNGVPLSNPMAVTPYPGRTSAAQREKARAMLIEYAKKMREEELKEPKKADGSAKSSASTDESAKSEKKIKKSKKKDEKKESTKSTKDLTKSSTKSSTSSDDSTESSKKTGKEQGKSTDASSNSKSSAKHTMGCDKCGSCRKCVQRCSEKHAAEVKVTDAEREKFLNGIKRLRKRIQKPEKSRERDTKSPYDVTQSSSDASIHEEKKAEKKEKSGK